MFFFFYLFFYEYTQRESLSYTIFSAVGKLKIISMFIKIYYDNFPVLEQVNLMVLLMVRM